MKRILDSLRMAWRLWRVRRSPLWVLARSAVQTVTENHRRRGQAESATAFCPRCGQVPEGDRRMEEAREIVMARLDELVVRRELDCAVAFHYWWGDGTG